jgi:hypothetical protein
MSNDLAMYCEYIPSLSRWRRDPEQDRRANIAARSVDIARLKVMQDIAADNSDYTEHERRKFAKEIIDIRRAIIATLSTDELTDMQARSLQPEDALQIVRDPPTPSPDSEETKALKKQLAAQRSAELGSRQYFVAEKGFAGTLQPGVSVDELIKNYPEQHKLIKRWQPPSNTQPEPMATVADAAFNHRRNFTKGNH